MWYHGGGDNNGKNSMYNLTLDEVQNQLGDLGKQLGSMNLDELLKNVWTVEANQFTSVDIEVKGATQTTQDVLQQACLALTRALNSKTVDEVWRDIQQSRINSDKTSHEKQSTLGEMTLEDFLVKAGVFVETSSDMMNTGAIIGFDSSVETAQFPQHCSWIHYTQEYQHTQQGSMDIYMPASDVPYAYANGQVALSSPIMGTSSDTRGLGEKTLERRMKRMIKNRESAARSRARKQAYTIELEHKVSLLEEEIEKLRREQEETRKSADAHTVMELDCE